jgi:hypothetical protein
MLDDMEIRRIARRRGRLELGSWRSLVKPATVRANAICPSTPFGFLRRLLPFYRGRPKGETWKYLAWKKAKSGEIKMSLSNI